MPLTQELQIFFHSAILVHVIISVVVVIIGYVRKNERARYLPLLFGANLVVFLSVVIVGINNLNFQLIDFVAFLGYSLIISYVVTIEIPGYILLSKYDSKLANILQSLRQKSIQLNYDIDSIDNFRSYFDENKKSLSSVTTNELLDSFITRCETIKNLDKSLYEVTIKELGEQIHYISSRSKHPFPKLIEILSLAGISFLLSQFLNYLFT